MKTLSIFIYILSFVFAGIGVYNLFALPHKFGGDAYTNEVSLLYAIAYFLLALIIMLFAHRLSLIEEVKEDAKKD